MKVADILKMLDGLCPDDEVRIAQKMEYIETCSTDNIESVIIERSVDDADGCLETVYFLIGTY